MPALIPTDHTATVLWLGRVPHRDRTEIDGEAVASLDLGFGGAVHEVHAGLTRPSCSRVTSQHPKGTAIANVRQLSIVSREEMDQIAAEMGVEALDPAWLGASVVVQGIQDFSHVPPSSRLQGPDGVTLVIDMQNRPCHLPAATIQEAVGDVGKAFKSAAKGRRGVTAWVERPGRIGLNDTVRLHIPDQRAWDPTR
ncbi:Putative metal-sulfur cluster biosynthesis proteins YuaD [Rhodobacteraceae bacterium THAF1]|uniref:MOSC domain-containing protein n=1 Tax=Palleronia sp. THAF1 TaxID=2587842 RepID=UPI000F418E82|nr:MOSC domain-containing protein [Palleronia sp. THAF1]QFU07392.1 Putative metal-sulfur cluster biosynthesis proteins YuaD [Palleronia sp. THAF1]VDC20696.1 Putative metal-sulfur cluster biosynthesis proteins YuaD [Rhodobacteraceae bacterium THAF1]